MNTDRRRFLGILAGVAAGGAGASAYARTSRADAGATFAASDVTVRTHDGALGAVTIAPAGTVSWSGLEEPAGSVALSLHAKLDSDLQYHELDGQRLDAAGLHGETDYEFETRNLLDGPGFTPGDFEPDDGETLTRQVRLRLGVTVYATDDETVLTSGYADAIFDVTVENRPENGGVEGEANTGGEAENGDETTETETSTTETETTETETSTTETETTETETGTTTTETTETETETTETTEDDNGDRRDDNGDEGDDKGNDNNSKGNKKEGEKNSYKWKENRNNGLSGTSSSGTASEE